MPKFPRFLMAALLFAAAGCAMQGSGMRAKSVIFFNAFSADLDVQALGTIAEFAADAKASTRPILIEGYADSTGSNQANQTLSVLRGQVVADAIAKQGIDRGRLVLRPRGPTTIDPGIESRRVDLEMGE